MNQRYFLINSINISRQSHDIARLSIGVGAAPRIEVRYTEIDLGLPCVRTRPRPRSIPITIVRITTHTAPSTAQHTRDTEVAFYARVSRRWASHLRKAALRTRAGRRDSVVQLPFGVDCTRTDRRVPRA